jgi:hypothetical protein
MTSEIERININETKMPTLQKCAGCKCNMLLSYFDIIENTGQLKKTCRKCLERNKINHDLVKYGNSIIYKIYCKDENITDCYVGSTIDFDRRKRNHKHKCNNNKSKEYNFPVYRFIRDNGGFDNWKFEVLENYPCGNKESLLFKECFWIEKLNTTLNSHFPRRSKKEWYEDNKNELLEYFKKYRENNIEKIREKAKEYRSRPEVKEYFKEYFKKYRENNKEKQKESDKKRYEKNKEKLSEKIECECGVVVCRSGLSRHKKTQKHQNYLKSVS